ncbi:MAG: hypothetical protein GXP24_13215 [Planctomycetes bacterium]|nr:hypothetical protein [Planctomycetota bacterium]
MAYSPLYEATDYFEPFPAPESVFAKDVDRHMEFLLPLATVSLSHINTKWSGKVHFVVPIEPWDGLVGEQTTKYHTYLCRTNWIGFKVNRQWKYSLDADFRYFLKSDVENRKDVKITKNEMQELNSHYELTRISFDQKRSHFKANGALHASYARRRNGQYPDDSRSDLTGELGGFAGWGNWPEIGDFPLSRHVVFNEEFDEEETTPLPQAKDESDFVFIGWIPAGIYCKGPSYNLYLFYHRKKRLALTTFDWS